MSKNRILDAALSIIDENIHLSHREIAEEIYAKSHYCDQDFNKFLAIFTSGTLTLRAYIRQRKLYFAVCDLLKHPEKPVADIAQENGYSDQSAFTRAVKNRYGEAPAELRKAKREIPDNRKELESKLASDNSRLDSIMERLGTPHLSDTDWHYFEDFIHATNELGFDISTCCLISELSEKLSIPFAYLIEKCFEMTVEYNQIGQDLPNELEDFMMELGIVNEEELEHLCLHYNCKWFELTFIKVMLYRLGLDSEDELHNIWEYYDCKWIMDEPYPVTRQMVQDYRNRNKHKPST